MTQTPPDDAIEATFAFVDLAGFTAMTEAHGDTEAVTIVRGFRDRALRVLGPGSELVKSIGDAVMLRFPTPLAAVVALRELLQRERVVKDAVLLPRAGPDHGPAMVVDGDYYGAAVNLAARVAGRRPRSCGRTARCSNPAFSAKSDSGMSQDVSAINCEQHHRILATPAEPTRPGREMRLSIRFKVLAAVVLFAPPAMVACGDDGGGGGGGGAATTANAPTETAAGQTSTTTGGDTAETTAVGQPATTTGGDTTPTTAPPVEATSTQPPAAASPAPTTTTVERPSQPVDQLVRIDRGQMHFRCVGAGPATVMLIAGWMDSGDKWGAIEPAVAEHARVCSYARFGTGTSDAPTTTQTFATQADDLHELLDAAGEPGPYLLVGQSFGGAIAVTFASKYGDEVAGLVLLDATPSGWPDIVCSVPAYQAGCAVMHNPALDPERVDVFPAFAAIATITSLGDLPMTVMTAAHRDSTGLAPGELERLDALWAKGQQHWAALSSSSTIVTVDDTGHHIEVDQPQLVIDELLKLLP